MARILYFGNTDESATSSHRANALERIGHHVITYDPYRKFKSHFKSKWLEFIHSRTGYIFLQPLINKWVKQITKLSIKKRVDAIWVDGGEYLGLNSLKSLKQLDCPIILYNVDDPTGKRDGRKFATLRKNISKYNLCALMRDINISEYKAKGANDFIRVYRSYDEIQHRPYQNIEDISPEFRSDVAFIGTWMRHEKRDYFLLELLNKGLNITIWGDRWEKSPYWENLKSHYRGQSLSGRDYVSAIQGSKICIGLLSKGNRDLHTQRSLEIPFAGGLLCAERTVEHLYLYNEGKEAVFWSNSEECAAICKHLLLDSENRENIRLAGMKKVRELKVGNEDVCRNILKKYNIV
jgi:spore maturation protein CgeB